MNRKISFLIVTVPLLLAAAVSVGVQVATVEALVPSVVSISSYDVGSVTWVNVTVNHTPPPPIDGSHYVSLIRLEINGTVRDFPRLPQSTETFSFQIDLGPNSNTYSVRALAVCYIHGPSAWSSLVTVPESSVLIALFMVLASATAILAKKTLRRHPGTNAM